jgi:neutral amino acid transport system ATP-binding protein
LEDKQPNSTASTTPEGRVSETSQTPISVSEDALLYARNLYKSFGGVKAVNNACLEVPEGSITGLIGPNGAGKTTLFNLLSNFIRSDRGEICFNGESLIGLSPHLVARRGLIRTFQVAKVLSKLSVLENMLLAAPNQTGEVFWKAWFQGRRVAREEKKLHQKAGQILASVGLAEKAHDYAGSLSGGQRKLLELARALMADPKLILLDEPAAGVNPNLVNQICQHITRWNREGMTFLIIEHNMDVVMSLCDRVWVLAEGSNLAVGTPEEIQQNPEVLQAYLGQ